MTVYLHKYLDRPYLLVAFLSACIFKYKSFYSKVLIKMGLIDNGISHRVLVRSDGKRHIVSL